MARSRRPAGRRSKSSPAISRDDDDAATHLIAARATIAWAAWICWSTTPASASIRDFEQSDPTHLRQVMEVNFFAAVEMTRVALPLLRAAGSPLIVNVASILGHRGIPHYTEYCASKFALVGFSESLRRNWRSRASTCLVVSPGTTQSEFFDRWWPSSRASAAAAKGRAARGSREADGARHRARAGI